jgi:WD40 repeat protein
LYLQSLPILQSRIDDRSLVLPAFASSLFENGICSRFVYTSAKHERSAINAVTWADRGQSIVTASFKGELSIWNGLSFYFERVIPAHHVAIRALSTSFNGKYHVTGDDHGKIVFWACGCHPIAIEEDLHTKAVRSITFLNNDHISFAASSDDKSVSIWDAATLKPTCVFNKHEHEVKRIASSLHNNLIISGTRNGDLMLWDPKSGNVIDQHKKCHQEIITKIAPHPSHAHLFLTTSRDLTVKIWDQRYTSCPTTTFFQTTQGYPTCASWHPQMDNLFATGSSEGGICYWKVEANLKIKKENNNRLEKGVEHKFVKEKKELEKNVEFLQTLNKRKRSKIDTSDILNTNNNENKNNKNNNNHKSEESSTKKKHNNQNINNCTNNYSLMSAHEGPVTDLVWHPFGHALCSTGGDGLLKIWSRPRPDDEPFTKFLVHNIQPLSAQKDYVQDLTEMIQREGNQPSASVTNLFNNIVKSEALSFLQSEDIPFFN